MVEVAETPRSRDLSPLLVRDHPTASPAPFVIEFGSNFYVLSGFGWQIVVKRRSARLRALIEAVFESEFGAGRPKGKWKRREV
jgi:hypothetical protein